MRKKNPKTRENPQFQEMVDLVKGGASYGEVARAYGIGKSALYNAMARVKPEPKPEPKLEMQPEMQPDVASLQVRQVSIWRLCVRVDISEAEAFLEAESFAEAVKRAHEVCAQRGLRHQAITSLSHIALAYSRR